MAKYKFENHSVELENPTITKLTTSFSIGDPYVRVSAILEANGTKAYGVELGEMENTANWTDTDVQAFAENKLNDYIV